MTAGISNHVPRLSAHCCLRIHTGKKTSFVNNNVSTAYADQVAPYRAFGCDMAMRFEGTLFRLPLRSEEQAAASTISKQVCGCMVVIVRGKEAV